MTDTRPRRRRTSIPSTPSSYGNSHSENQERAYIAASRRSDRSLEARMASALKASEIHKARTGRALKITMDSIVKDELYEEDDVDFSKRRYRLLHPSLQTESKDFNDRLNAYLDETIAFRRELGRAAAGCLRVDEEKQQPMFANVEENKQATIGQQMSGVDKGQAAEMKKQDQDFYPFTFELPSNAAQMFPANSDPFAADPFAFEEANAADSTAMMSLWGDVPKSDKAASLAREESWSDFLTNPALAD